MFFLGLMGNTRLKEHFLWAFLGGVHCDAIQDWTHKFVSRLVNTGMRREGLVAVEKHRANGDVLVLLSASLDIYVKDLGARLGFEEVLCTEVHWQGDRLSGRLSSPNCFGEEKVRRVGFLGGGCEDVRKIAYADHESDFRLLRFVNHGILVNGKAKTKDLARQIGIECCTWRD
jgi:phosphatidylglycerophosphatase C